MAGGTFDKTVGKVRPGTYVNFKDTAQESIKGSARGTVLLPLINTDYGPAGEMISLNGGAPDAARAKLGYSVYDDDPAGNMLLIREAFKNASTVIVYICTEGTAEATATGGGLTATAKYKGTRGNKLTYSVSANPIDGFDVAVYIDGSKVELYEGVTDETAVKELARSEYITFALDSSLEETAGTTLEGGTSAQTQNGDITNFLEAADSVKFNTMAFPKKDATLQAAVKTKVRYMRENEGKKVQAVVADIAEADAIDSGEERSGMFFAARTFAMKMGQAISMLIFTSVVSAFTVEAESGSSTNPFGYRLTAIIATVFCLIGAVLFFFYNEKKIMGKISARKREGN